MMKAVQAHGPLVLIVAFLACGHAEGSRPSTRTPTPTYGPTLTTLLNTSTLSVRVTRSGEPVAYYGLFIGKYPTIIHDSQPIPVRSSDGRFATRVSTGTHDLVVAGPGFKRTIIRNVLIQPGSNANREIVIQVERGEVVQGVVIDVANRPVSNAHVRITNTSGLLDPDDLLTQLAAGNFVAVTDNHGVFRIEDVFREHSAPRIFATHLRQKSVPIVLPAHASPVQLTIRGTGDITGSVTSTSLQNLVPVVVARTIPQLTTVFSAKIRLDGSFEFLDIPSGEYELGVYTRGPHRSLSWVKRVSVSSGTKQTISL